MCCIIQLMLYDSLLCVLEYYTVYKCSKYVLKLSTK